MSVATGPAADERVTYLHLVPEPVWRANEREEYFPEAFDREGFIHCTIGDAELIAAANRFYVEDPRSFLVLTLDPARITSPVTIEDPRSVFPHIFGPLNRDAVIGTRRMSRDAGGTFLSIEPAGPMEQ